ncbi:hypothetical protein LXL04_008060 [Taraxacum kok-saghyz]
MDLLQLSCYHHVDETPVYNPKLRRIQRERWRSRESPSRSGITISSSSNRLFFREEEESEREQTIYDFPLPIVTRNGSSKYDFVMVKVWLGDNADHYYVLSRFLLSRMLTVTKIPNHTALKIALELKKLLVDNSLLDVSQSDLETNMFKVISVRLIFLQYKFLIDLKLELHF